MIRYALVCDRHHEFESWFTNSESYDAQARQGLVACPLCGSVEVEKALMTPQVARTRTPAEPPPGDAPDAAPGPDATRDAALASGGATPGSPVAMMTAREQELRRRLRELRDHLVKNAEDVGPRFPEEARKMHYQETGHRSIYGIASPEEAAALSEEGITFSTLPILPDDRN